MTLSCWQPAIAETAMNDHLANFADRYLMTLRKFTAAEREADLEQAYHLGRNAMVHQFGILDMARLHQNALLSLLPSLPASRQKEALSAAEVFFLQSLSPFEATHRGFQDTNRRLQELISVQQKRNRRLATVNSRLTEEIRRRRDTEAALRQSERHFRQLFGKARAMQESLRDLSNQILNAQEDERCRISRELHDETAQALAAISVTLASLDAKSQISLARRQKLRAAQRLLRATMETVHNFARELRPPALDELGLMPALRSYLAAFRPRTGLKVRLVGDPAAEKMAAGAKIVLFRITQEILAGIARHAHATHVELRLRKLGHRICMIISDNGKAAVGKPSELAKDRQRLSLLGMQERIRLLNGHIAICPHPRKGTVVSITVPLNPNGAIRRNNFNPAR